MGNGPACCGGRALAANAGTSSWSVFFVRCDSPGSMMDDSEIRRVPRIQVQDQYGRNKKKCGEINSNVTLQTKAHVRTLRSILRLGVLFAAQLAVFPSGLVRDTGSPCIGALTWSRLPGRDGQERNESSKLH